MFRIIYVLALPIALYLYFFIKRCLVTFSVDVSKRWVKISIAVAALSIGLLSANVFNSVSVVMLHIIFISMLISLVNLIVKLIFRERYDGFFVWKKLYGSGALAVLLTALLLTYGYFNLMNVQKTSYTVETDKSIRDNGYRVALLSDIHYGVSIDKSALYEMCDEISREEPDIVILCGDIVDNDTTPAQVDEVFDALGKIKSEYGIFYVHGNHDRPHAYKSMGVVGSYSDADLINAIQSNGITILQDEIYEINDDLLLVGREDLSSKGRVELKTLLDNVDKSKFILTLDHQPREYENNARLGTDLILSGHTHGGQLWPLKQVQEIFKMNDFVYGQTFVDEDTQAIVSAGVAGWKYPFKTAAPAEYVIVDIK